MLLGQAIRSGGAIPVDGYAEFEAAVDLLSENAALRSALVAAGRRYVRANYEWEVVLDRVEACLLTARAHHQAARSRPRPGDEAQVLGSEDCFPQTPDGSVEVMVRVGRR